MKTLLKWRFGLTMVELMVTVLIATVVFAGIGVAMIDSIKSFPKMYQRTEGDVINDAYVAKGTFDSICRQAIASDPCGPFTGTQVTVYYYSSPTSPLDSYARFAFANNLLTVSYGSGGVLGTPVVLARNVQPGAFFAVQGSSVSMAFTIDNTADTSVNAKEKMIMTVTSTAVRHN